jgi:haloacid dehalogenase-like hydrolase
MAEPTLLQLMEIKSLTWVTQGGGNDIAMFGRSGLCIAMGNASVEVQRAADFVTNSNREDGFANAIERFILGHNRSNIRVVMAPTPSSSIQSRVCFARS